tara:strand:+ start:476 stop:1657 length:1182 start_codon:yes stop_codon:yes gene_type:complete
MKKSISILGSTGSIGLNSIKIIKKKKKLFRINILAANKNYKLICKQINELNPEFFFINNLKVFQKVKKKFQRKNVKIINNFDFKINSLKNSEITIAAIPGIAGLKPTLELLKKSKKLLIANKESIICGWNLIEKLAIKNNTKIIPIDSEHFSIMKLLENQKIQNINKIYLTASGGPFFKSKLSKLKNVKPNQAIKHPKWKMGKKISIDSSTMMNKLLEVVEAHKLFKVKLDNIKIVIHPESLIHAVIEFKNGLHKFIYHETSMIIPLANAIFDEEVDISLFYKKNFTQKKNFFLKNLSFFDVDSNRYPIIKLKSRFNEYPSTPIIINAVNEILVDQFLRKKIPFNSFYSYILNVLNDRNYKKYAVKMPKNINQIFQIDQWSRKIVCNKLKDNA